MGLFIMPKGKVQTSTKDAGKNASKNAQAAKAGKSKGGKTKKKSWTKTKVKEKLNNAVYLDDKQFERMLKEVPKILCVTRAVLIEKLKLNLLKRRHKQKPLKLRLPRPRKERSEHML